MLCRLRWAPTLVLAFSLTGCGYVLETAADLLVGADSSRAAAPEPVTMRRVVVEKAPPRTLIARDGYSCVVPETRFRHVRIGQRIVCVWTRGSHRPLTGTPGG